MILQPPLTLQTKSRRHVDFVWRINFDEVFLNLEHYKEVYNYCMAFNLIYDALRLHHDVRTLEEDTFLKGNLVSQFLHFIQQIVFLWLQ